MMISSTSSSPIYDIAPPTRTSSSSRRRKRKRSSRLGLQQQPPLIVRILTILLSIIACLLLLSTIYLFHLHHAHLHDDTNNNGYNSNDAAGASVAGAAAVGPGGSAQRHKIDLVNFLLRRQQQQQHKDEQQQKQQQQHEQQNKNESQEKNGQKGGGDSSTEKKFIALVKNESSSHQKDQSNNDGNEKKKKKEMKQKVPNKNNINNNNNYLEIIQDWKKLQHTLLQNNTALLLPTPIPRTRTSRAFSGLLPPLPPSHRAAEDDPTTTPPAALKGAKRGTISCPDVADPRINDVMSSMLAFWNEPRGTRDALAEYYSDETTTTQQQQQQQQQQHPFIPKPLNKNLTHQNLLQTVKSSRRRYLTFEPDTGGWNNMRISFEIVLMLAALSGRVLVLPPEQVMYLLQPKRGDERNGRRQYTDYYNLTDNMEFMRHVPIITAEEFLQLEGGQDGVIPLTGYNDTWTKHLQTVSKSCEERKKSDVFCEDLYDHYASHGLVGPITSEAKYANILVFDEKVFLHGNDQIDKLAPEVQQRIKAFCGEQRYPVYYNQTMHDTPVWHFETRDLDHRLLVHFYAILFFTDDKIGNFYKRFARDFFRYPDEVFCAAGKIILALQYENNVLSGTMSNPMADLDAELVGGYSSLHVRRGDLQFKEVALNSSQWYENTKELWKPNEILYIATDERNNSFFDDFRKKHSPGQLRFLDDFKTLANLDSIDQTLYGMIDTVVASRGSVFAGTWFSTFSGYIVRLRGYYGFSKYFTYYSYLPRKFFMHKWMDIQEGSAYAREYPTAWTGIDGDVLVEKDEELERDDAGYNPLQDSLFPREAMDKLKERMMKMVSK